MNDEPVRVARRNEIFIAGLLPSGHREGLMSVSREQLVNLVSPWS